MSKNEGCFSIQFLPPDSLKKKKYYSLLKSILIVFSKIDFKTNMAFDIQTSLVVFAKNNLICL